MPRLIDDELFGRQPDGRVVDPDLIEGALRSKSFATVIDLLGYGEIEGLRRPTNTNPETADSLDYRRDIFLDGTPIANADGSLNFQNVEIIHSNGLQVQRPVGAINGFGPDRVENTIPVGLPVTKDTPVARSINSVQDADGNELIKLLRVTIQIPALQEFTTDGNIIGTEVKISIRITENDGTVHNPVVEDSINGKATSAYVRDYEIDLTEPTADLQFPLTVTVIRNTDDSTESTLQNTTNFFSITTIIPEFSDYPGFATVVLRFNAQEFQSFPRRMYRVKGTKISVPNGTTIDLDNGRVIYPTDYVFDGTFKTE